MKSKNKIRIKGSIKLYLQSSIYMGVLLLILDLGIYLMDIISGLMLSIFLLLYFILNLYLYFRNKAIVLNELISFATEYGQIQRQLLKELELPYALLDDSGKIIWTNHMFNDQIYKVKGMSKPISNIFPQINVEKLLEEQQEEIKIPMTSADGFELPDFLQGEKDDILKIE